MKNTIRSFSFVVLAVIYCCFNVFFTSGNNLISNDESAVRVSSSEGYYLSSFDYGSLLYRMVEGRGVFTVATNLPSVPLHYRFSDFSEDCKKASLFYLIGFSKYLVYSATIVLWFQPVDIVFPAHYFW
jgi:hypothetical protein